MGHFQGMPTLRPSAETSHSRTSGQLAGTTSTSGAFAAGRRDAGFANRILPRQRNLWVTDAFEWRPEVGLTRPPNAG